MIQRAQISHMYVLSLFTTDFTSKHRVSAFFHTICFSFLESSVMTNLEKITSRKRTFLQYQDTEITGVDYGYEDDDLLKLYDDCGDDESSSSPPIEPPSRRERLPTHKTNTKDQSIQSTAFNFTTSLASIAGSLEKNKEHLDAQKQNDSARRLITLQQFLQTPIQRPKYQAFAIPKYDYSNAQWPGGRPLDKEIIRIEGKIEESECPCRPFHYELSSMSHSRFVIDVGNFLANQYPNLARIFSRSIRVTETQSDGAVLIISKAPRAPPAVQTSTDLLSRSL